MLGHGKGGNSNLRQPSTREGIRMVLVSLRLFWAFAQWIISDPRPVLRCNETCQELVRLRKAEIGV